MNRPSIDQYYLRIAHEVATRATCVRRQVGCVLVDPANRVLATGHNGNPPGMPHCIDAPCPGAEQPPGQGLDLCGAIHAEINALISCHNNMLVSAVYCTVSPCITCVNALMATSAGRMVFSEEYASEHTERAKAQWTSQGRHWHFISKRELNLEPTAFIHAGGDMVPH